MKTATQPAPELKRIMETARIHLRVVDESDLDDYIELFSNPKSMRFIGIDTGYVPNRAEIAGMLNAAIDAWKTRGYGRWSLFEKCSGEFIGFCGFRAEAGLPDLIALLKEKFWNRGLAGEAAVACLDYGYDELGFTEIKAHTHPDHARARRVLEKLAARFEGYIDFHGITGAKYELNRGYRITGK